MHPKLILPFLCAALLCGCASAGRDFDTRKVAQIRQGETTVAELVQWFGSPGQRGVNSERGTTLTWVYAQAQVSGATFIPLVGAFAGGVTTQNKCLIVRLNPAGLVTSYDFSGGTMNSGPDGGDTEHPATPAKSPKGQ